MDYSTLPQGIDEDADSSPWSTSPRATRRDLQASTSSDQQISSDLLTGGGKDSSLTDPFQSGAASDTTGEVRTAGNGLGINDSDNRQGTLSSDGPQRHDARDSAVEGQRTPVRTEQRGQPQRYHQQTRPSQRATIPQYKLQAKVTALERTGRKDPILRFDVHVRLLGPIVLAYANAR